jgi:hypothetical protein
LTLPLFLGGEITVFRPEFLIYGRDSPRVNRESQVFSKNYAGRPRQFQASSKADPAKMKRMVLKYVKKWFKLHEMVRIVPLASSGGVAAEFVRIVGPPVALLANLLAFLVFPVLPAGEIARRERFKIWLQR